MSRIRRPPEDRRPMLWDGLLAPGILIRYLGSSRCVGDATYRLSSPASAGRPRTIKRVFLPEGGLSSCSESSRVRIHRGVLYCILLSTTEHLPGTGQHGGDRQARCVAL